MNLRLFNIEEADQAFATEIAGRITSDKRRFNKGSGKKKGAVTYVYYIRDADQTVEICYHGYQEDNGTLIVEKILEKHFKTGANHILGTSKPVDSGRWVWFGDNKRDQKRKRN